MTGAEMLAKVLPRLAKLPGGSGVSFVDALNIAVDVFFERLHRKRSEIARVQFDDLDVDEEINTLPTSFRGLASAISLINSAGIRFALSEFPYDGDEDEIGDPRYFRLMGARQIQILPAPDVAYVLDGWYYAHPGTLALTSTIPWSGLFDAILADAIVMIVAAGSIEAMTGQLRESLGTMIEGVITGRTVTPRRNRLW